MGDRNRLTHMCGTAPVEGAATVSCGYECDVAFLWDVVGFEDGIGCLD